MKNQTKRKSGLMRIVASKGTAKAEIATMKQALNILTSNLNHRHAPFDLQDRFGNGSISSDGLPLPQLIKTSGINSEIGYGNASLSETAVQYMYPLLTLIGIAAMSHGMMHLTAFLILQLVWAGVSLALMGRSWYFAMLPTIKYTLGFTALAVLASSILPHGIASTIVGIFIGLMLGRPFLEQFLVNVDGSKRPFPVHEPFVAPFEDAALSVRIRQSQDAAADQTAIMSLGDATGDIQHLGDRQAPDEGNPFAMSQADAGLHTFVGGASGSGKTAGVVNPLMTQWVALGQKNDSGFKNGGGLAIFCGKGALGVDAVQSFRRQRLHEYLNIHLISPQKGETRIAFMKGLTPQLLAATIAKMYSVGDGDGDGKNDFYPKAAIVLLTNAAILIDAAVELEKFELENRAVAAGYKCHADWRSAINIDIPQRTWNGRTLESLGITNLESFNQWLVESGMSPQHHNALRYFYWTWNFVTNMSLSWLDDAEYMLGVSSPPAATSTGAPVAPVAKVVQAIPAPVLDKPFTEWIKSHPAVLNPGNTRGKLILDACSYVEGWFALNGETRTNIQATLRNWLDPLQNSRELRSWADIEGDDLASDENGVSYFDEYIEEEGATGADRPGDWYRSKVLDLKAVLQGAIVGFALPHDKYGIAGETVTQLAKASIYSAIKLRPSNWSDDPKAKSVMVVIDEAHLVLKGSPSSLPDEIKMASIGRSLGIALVIATQGRALLDGMFGGSAVDGMLNNFASVISFKCDDNTLGYLNNNVIGKHTVYKYNFKLHKRYKEAISSEYVSLRDQGRVEYQAPSNLGRLQARLRFTAARPAGVILDDDAKSILLDPSKRTGSMVRSIGHLAWLCTGGLVTNVIEPFKGTSTIIRYGLRAALAWAHGDSRDLDGYDFVPLELEPSQDAQASGLPFGARKVELFPETSRALLDRRFHAVGRIKRAGAPRHAVFKTIGPLNREKLEAIAAKQPGIETIYTYIERQEKQQAQQAQQQAIVLTKAA